MLHNISPSVVDHDIGIFLEHSFKLIANEHALGTGWPGEQIVNRLVNNASGLFIWAATACRFVREGTKGASKLQEGSNCSQDKFRFWSRVWVLADTQVENCIP